MLRRLLDACRLGFRLAAALAPSTIVVETDLGRVALRELAPHGRHFWIINDNQLEPKRLKHRFESRSGDHAPDRFRPNDFAAVSIRQSAFEIQCLTRDIQLLSACAERSM